MTVRGRRYMAAAALVVVAGVAVLLWPRPLDRVDVVGRVGQHEVRLLIETPAVGVQNVTVDVTGPVDRLVVAPVMVEMGHAATPVTATAAADGRYMAPGVEFFMPGRWDVGITVHSTVGADEVVFPVLIAP